MTGDRRSIVRIVTGDDECYGGENIKYGGISWKQPPYTIPQQGS